MRRLTTTFGWLPMGILGMGAALALASCGGGAGDDDVDSTSAGPLMDTSGGEPGGEDDALADLPPEPEDPEPAEEPAPTYGDAVSVPVQLQVGSDVGTGTFQLMNLDGEVVAEGDSGDQVTVPTGPYTVSASITDPRQLIDTPTRQESVEIGQVTPMVVVRFPRSQVLLRIRRGGRAVRRATVVLLPQTGPGEPDPEPIAEIDNPRRSFSVTPGRYDAMIKMGSLQVPVQGLVFQDGAQQEVPVNIN